MIEKSKYHGDVMKNHFNKEHMMTKENNEDFQNATKFWICYDTFIDGDVKVRDRFHIIGKCRGSAQRNRSITVKLDHKTPVVFHNLKIMIHILLCKN